MPTRWNKSECHAAVHELAADIKCQCCHCVHPARRLQNIEHMTPCTGCALLLQTSVELGGSDSQHSTAVHSLHLSTSTESASAQASGAAARPSMAIKLRLPVLPLAIALPSAGGATPRSVRFQLDDTKDSPATSDAQDTESTFIHNQQHGAETPSSPSPKLPAGNASSQSAPPHQSSQELRCEPSFTFASDAESGMTAKQTISTSLGAPALSPPHLSCHHHMHEPDNSQASTDMEIGIGDDAPLPDANQMVRVSQDSSNHVTGMSLTDTAALEARIERAMLACNAAGQKFEQGRDHVRKGLAGQPEKNWP